MRTLSALLAACLLAPAAMARAEPDPPAAAPVQQEQLYWEAMRALADDQPERAAALLIRFLEREPRHAGAWLDLAISQCALGHAVEAERLFQEIEHRFAPPPGIMEIIQEHRRRGCDTTPARRPLVALSLSRGHDSNVNQGIASNTFTTGSGSGQIEWNLGPEYQPRADNQTLLDVDVMQRLDEAGTLVLAQLRGRRNDSMRQQDTASALVGVERPWQWGGWQGHALAAFSLLRLDRALYQRQSQIQLRAAPPLQPAPRWEWSLLGSLSHVGYPTRTKYDANTLELGTSMAWRGPRQQALLSVSALSDYGQTGRLGGNRDGWYSAFQLSSQLPGRLKGELSWSRQVWRSQTAYAPGLIDQVRHQDMQQLRAALQLPLTAHQSLQLEWRAIRNRENIPLFQYNSRLIQLNWRWDNF